MEQVLTGVSSQGFVPDTESANTGVGFASSFPTSPQITAVSDSVRSCGPSTSASSYRDPGCTPDLRPGSPYGVAGSPGFGPAQWAFTGSTLGPPEVPTGENVLGECAYSLSVAQDNARGLECRLAPAKGGYPWPPQYADGVAIARFATGGWTLPPGTAAAQLPEAFRVECVHTSAPVLRGMGRGVFVRCRLRCVSLAYACVCAGMPPFPCAGASSKAVWRRTGRSSRPATCPRWR